MGDTTITPTPRAASGAASGTAATSGPPRVTLAAKVMEWTRPVIALFSMGIFAAAFWFAWHQPDASTINILVGAIVSLVSSISGYYFGSSAGSQKKDDVIHAALATAQGQGGAGG